jgi:hypothetical protein
VRHGDEYGIICLSANCGDKQNKQELVRHHQVDEKAVHAELDRNVAKIEINDINLALGIREGSKEVNVSKRSCGCRFICDEFMLTGIKIGLKMV